MGPVVDRFMRQEEEQVHFVELRIIRIFNHEAPLERSAAVSKCMPDKDTVAGALVFKELGHPRVKRLNVLGYLGCIERDGIKPVKAIARHLWRGITLHKSDCVESIL